LCFALYPLSLHDALPILIISLASVLLVGISTNYSIKTSIITLLFPKVMELYEKENQISLKELDNFDIPDISKEISDFLVVILFRSEEHTSELQSRFDLVC